MVSLKGSPECLWETCSVYTRPLTLNLQTLGHAYVSPNPVFWESALQHICLEVGLGFWV